MTGRSQRTAVLTQRIAVDPTRIPSTPPGVPSYRDEIAIAASTIAERFDPERVVLFGSRAAGTPRPDSDIDLMVVMDTAINLSTHADTIRRAVDVGLPVRLQVLVRQPDDIASRLAEGDFFIEDVMLKGITLYARNGMDDLPPARRQSPSPDEPKRLTAATKDWLRKADKDARSARFNLTAPDPDLDLVCFLAQQCTEKALKGLLEQRSIRFPRTHDLAALAELAAPIIPALGPLADDLDRLSTCAVDPRYPGLDIDAAQVDAALRTMTTIRELISTALEFSEGDQD